VVQFRLERVVCSECTVRAPEAGGAWCVYCSRLFHEFQPAHERHHFAVTTSVRWALSLLPHQRKFEVIT
jgi:hypothetical protein